MSNSLLSELDEAIKQLPGSTGVQKLLVTRVLEHLDRMAREGRVTARLNSIWWMRIHAWGIFNGMPTIRIWVIPRGHWSDELGQNGTASLADSAGAVAAYRQTLALDDRALKIDPNFLRAKRGLAITRMKIGSVEIETDPAEALKEFQVAFRRADALPTTAQGGLSTVRMRAMLLRKEASAFEHLGAFAQAIPLFAQSREILQGLASQDPKDFRARFDAVTVLDDEARNYEDSTDPVLVSRADERRESDSCGEDSRRGRGRS